MRVCAAASGFSTRRLGTAKGTLASPMPSSIGDSVFGSGMNSAISVGPTLRCSQATGLPLRVEPGLQVLDRDRVIVGMVQVVVARPHHLDRLAAGLAREQRRLGREVALALAAEAAAQQRDVDRHLVGRQVEPLGHVVAHRLRALERAPQLAAAVLRCARSRPAAPSAPASGAACSTAPSRSWRPSSSPHRHRRGCGSPCPGCRRPPPSSLR